MILFVYDDVYLRAPAFGERRASVGDLLIELVGELSGGLDLGEDLGVAGLDVGNPVSLVGADVDDLETIEESADASKDSDDLLLDGHGGVLALLEELLEALSALELLLRGGVEVRAELGKGGDFTVLGKLELHGTSDLLHGLDLGGGADAGDGETDVDGGADTLVEEIVLEKDLSVRNGDNVGGNVRRHVTSLGLDDGEGSQGAGAHGVGHLGGALEEAGVKVEDITGVRLATRGTAEEEGHLAVRDGLLGKVIVKDDGVHAVVAKVLADGGARVGREELEGCRVGRGSGDDDRVLERIVLLHLGHDLGDRGALLADGDVDAVERLGLITSVVDGLLVDDGVDGDGGLASLAIADDELTLAAADGDERVDSLEASLHGLVDGLAGEDTGGLDFDTLAGDVLEGGAAIDGLSEGVDDASEELLADGDVDDGSRALDDVSFDDLTIVTEDDDTDVVVLKIERHTLDTSVDELNHFSGLDVVEAVDAGDTVTTVMTFPISSTDTLESW